MSEQAVIVELQYGQTDLDPLFELEDKLIAAVDSAGVGEFDGNEIAQDGSDGSLYMYGPDADKLFEAIQPVLQEATCIRSIVATIRYGPPQDGVRERQVKIRD